MADEEIRKRIMDKAEEMFIQYGYSKVTMDEIAFALGMSKKTLYKFFAGKEDLIKKIISELTENMGKNCDDIFDDTETDFIIRLREIMSYIAKQTSKLRGPLLEDLQKSIPECWKKIDDFRKERVRKKWSLLIKQGIENGSFRKDINEQIVVLMYANAIQGIINPEVLSQLPLTAAQVFDNVIKIIFEGILSDQGREKYISSIKNEKENINNE